MSQSETQFVKLERTLRGRKRREALVILGFILGIIANVGLVNAALP